MTIATINGAASIAWTLTDAAELIWNTYGVSSKIGRLAERSERKAHEIACLLDDALRCRRPNRFVFADCSRGTKLPGMTREQHVALGATLKGCERFAMLHFQAEPTYKRTGRAQLWQKLLRTISKFKCGLDDLALCENESEHALRSYYGNRAQ